MSSILHPLREPPQAALIVGCGYLGQRVAARWQSAGTRVICLTRSASRAEEFRNLGWEPVIADVCDPASLLTLPPVDVVFWGVGYDRTSGRTQHEVYVDGLRSLLDVMVRRALQFLYVSSSSVYGQQGGEWVDEDSLCEPTQPGGQCCLAAEELVLERYAASAGTASILRLSGIYGPQRLLSRAEALKKQTPITGSPDAWLNLIHVDDAATAVIASQQHGLPGARYLITDHEPIRRATYYQHLASLLDAPAPVFDDSLPAKRGAGGLNKRCRNTRMQHELGVPLQYPTYREGLRNAIGLREGRTTDGT
jgi:nucleoside-diphosphate-sugar epimerase